MRSSHLDLLLVALVFLTLSVLPATARAGSFFVRVAAAYEQSDDATLLDVDCASTSPPALFGCVADEDGRPLAARGDFGYGAAWEVSGGVEVGRRSRLDLSLIERSNLDLDSEANFLGVSANQPVDSSGRSRAAMLGIAFDLGRPAWRIQPFVGVAAGVAWNETGDVNFRFPSISPEAATVIHGGRHSDFAWSATLGVAFRWTDATVVELALRTTDLGELRTDPGTATIVRPSGTFQLDIAGTHADLSTTGLVVAVRHRFRIGS